jgi:hypothetical protein
MAAVDPMNLERTSNIEHRTPNIDWPGASAIASVFAVRCSLFDVCP